MEHKVITEEIDISPLRHAIDEPIVNLGTGSAYFSGIFAPVSEIGRARVGVTQQFLENADTYHAKYSDNHYWSLLLDVALDRMGTFSPATILDIGSGSGNSVIPLLKRFQDARVIASDISPNLLAILRDYFGKDEQTLQRLDLLCADASSVHFAEGFADLVVGAAILHHIVEPETVVQRAFTALRPGGWAVFFEPFKSGSSLLSLAYKQVLRAAPFHKTEKRWVVRADPYAAGLGVLARIVHDYDTRVAMSQQRASELDDKWMFQKSQFEHMARAQGWARCDCYSMQDGKSPVRSQTVAYLRLAAQLDETALPKWAWEILDEFDTQLSDDVRKSAWMEAMVLLQKPGEFVPSGQTILQPQLPYNRWYWTPDLDKQGIFLSKVADRVSIYWCGYDTSGRNCVWQIPLNESALGLYDIVIGGRLATVRLEELTLRLIEGHGNEVEFNAQFDSMADDDRAQSGIYLHADSAHTDTLICEFRKGMVQLALLNSKTTEWEFGALSGEDGAWTGTLCSFEGGSPPFSDVRGSGKLRATGQSIHIAFINNLTLAVSIGGMEHVIYSCRNANLENAVPKRAA